MKWLVTALLLCALPHHSTAVTELTDQNFYGYAQDKEVLLVDFYAPWCGDCKNLDPDFESAARSLGQRSVDLVKVDCFGAGKGLCATYGVKSWPTLKNFNRGQYTGDYNGGLSAAELAGYITTVENSVIQQGVSPYAASQPIPSIPVDVACNKKCKLERAKASKLASKLAPVAPPAGAPAVLAPPAPLMPSKEQLNAMECAKCKIMQPAEKLSNHCPASLRRTCILTSKREHRSGISKRRNSAKTNRASKKTAIQTLTSAPNDNLVKIRLKEALIVPPNAGDKTDIQLFTGKEKPTGDKDARKADVLSSTDDGDKKGTATKETSKEVKDTDEEKNTKITEDADKSTDISTKETLKLLHDADDKKNPVLNFPHDKLQTAIKIPPHDAGDKKASLERVTSKDAEDVQYPTPKVGIKQINKHKFAPKFAHMKVPPHDSGDKKADLHTTDMEDSDAGDNAVTYPAPKPPSKNFIGPHKEHLGAKPLRPNNAKLGHSVPRPSISNMIPQTGAALKAQNLNHKKQYMAPKLSFKLPINKKLSTVKNIPSIRNFKVVQNKGIERKAALQNMSPREALRVPYDADDKKRSFSKRTKVD